MNTENNNDRLIDNLFENSTDIEQVLTLVRKEKSVRRRRRTRAQSVAILLLVAGFFIAFHNPDTTQESLAQSTPFSVLRFINDDELFELLGDQPLAIIRGENNTQCLVLLN